MDIIVTENVETVSEQLNRYILTGKPELFLKMEKEIQDEIHDLLCINNLDKMINKALKSGCYIIGGKTKTIMLDTVSDYIRVCKNPSFEKINGTAEISDIRIREKLETFKRYDSPVGLTLESLCECIFPKFEIKTWPQKFDVKIHHVEIDESREQELVKNVPVLLSKLNEQLLPENFDFLEKTEQQFLEIKEAVWNSIINRLILEFGPDYKLNKLGIKQMFIPPCEHDTNSELTLSGDYFVCSHGNPISCRHIMIEAINDRVTEFGNPCKICGAKFHVIREIMLPDVDFYTVKFDAELHKKLFGKTMMAFKNIKFRENVTDDLLRKITKNIVGNIVNFVANNIEKIERMKGYSPEVITAMSEIITQLYIYAALVNLCTRNDDITFKNFGSGISEKEEAIHILGGILKIYTARIKNFKAFNLVNSFTAVLDELKSTKNVKTHYVTRDIGSEPIKIPPKINLKIYIRFAPNINFIYPQISGDIRYLSYKYSDHEHDWSLALVAGVVKKLSEITFAEFLDTLVCNICGTKWADIMPDKKSVEFAIKERDKKAINDFYYDYCPVNVKHEMVNGVCTACGYGGPKFAYDVPNNRIILPTFVKKTPNFIPESTENEVEPVLCNFSGTVIKDKIQYYNFWKNFYCNEDVTMKNLLMGVKGNIQFAVPKIRLEFTKFATYLSQKNYAKYSKIILQLNESFYLFTVDFMTIKNKFITVFNQVAAEVSDYFVDLVKRMDNTAMSDESVKAAALISFKQKMSNDVVKDQDSDLANADADTVQEAINSTTYEGFDYDGHNEEM